MWWYMIVVFVLGAKSGESLSSTTRATQATTSGAIAYLNLTEVEMSKNVLQYYKVNLNNETQLRGIRMPCQCLEEQCGCCSGNFLQNFNIHMRQHFCINMTYEHEDLSLGVKMSFNDLVLLTRSVSGKNPPPLCIPIPRVANIRFCGKFTNVYFIGRNIHACVTIETEWNNRTVFSYSFDCVRLGVNGVAIVPPEAGGGLPHPIEEVDNIEEYDELLENQSTSTTKRPKRKRTTTTTASAAIATVAY